MFKSSAITKTSGFLIILLSTTMLFPIAIDFWYEEEAYYPFLKTFLILFFGGCGLYLPFRNTNQELRSKDGFFIVVLIWTLFSLLGALPFYLGNDYAFSLTDAVFETVSGLTTTGATVMEGLDYLPKAILYYRQQLQFLGGLGVVLLAVAILPTLGVGGMQLLKAEASGPIKDQKLTPRVTETARRIWFIYLLLTLICAISYKLCGMDTFDAISHSFASIATGGFSTHDANISFFGDNVPLKLCMSFFMLLGAISLPLHFMFIARKDIKLYWQDTETRVFILSILFSCLLIGLTLSLYNNNTGINQWVDTIFQTISFSTTTGFITTNYHQWPVFLPTYLLLLGVVGGCAGSTSGGFKIIRVILLQKQGLREIHRLIHPHSTQIIKLGKNPVPTQVLDSIWGFLSIYVFIFFILLLMILMTESDFVTAYSALVATISNTGPALGTIYDNFSTLNASTKWILSASMIIGRLEFFTLLIIFTPAFWKN